MILPISVDGNTVRGTALAGVHNKSHIDDVWNEQNPYGIQFNFFFERDILIHEGGSLCRKSYM